ncbi:hypothetical protein PMAYCL1PPCAC_01035, partial [Pristionchus mayeri]
TGHFFVFVGVFFPIIAIRSSFACLKIGGLESISCLCSGQAMIVGWIFCLSCQIENDSNSVDETFLTKMSEGGVVMTVLLIIGEYQLALEAAS